MTDPRDRKHQTQAPEADDKDKDLPPRRPEESRPGDLPDALDKSDKSVPI